MSRLEEAACHRDGSRRIAGRDGALARACSWPRPAQRDQGATAQRRPSPAVRSARSPPPSPIRASPPRWRAAASTVSSDFRFTPTSAFGDRSRGVRSRRARPRSRRPAMASRDAGPTSSSAVTAITPSSYNLGVSVGWRRFAVSGDVAQADNGLIAGIRESAQVGMSYRATRRLTGRVAVARRARPGRPAHHRRGPGLFARRRRRLFDRAATSM